MPGMDGLEAARRIRAAETERGAARTPIVALTANAFAEDREACLAAGMDGFLVKPLDRERLAAALAEVAARLRLSALAARRLYNFLSATSSTMWLSAFFRMRSARWRVGRMFSCRLTRLMRSQIEVAVATASVVGQFRIAMEVGFRIAERRAAQGQEAVDVPVLQHALRRRRDRPRNRRSPTRTEWPCRPSAGGRSAARSVLRRSGCPDGRSRPIGSASRRRPDANRSARAPDAGRL